MLRYDCGGSDWLGVCWVAATATATIVIKDVNDNPPKCDPDYYDRQVSELAGPLTFIVQVEVRDADSDAVFAYELDGLALMNFTIDSDGNIYIRDQQVSVSSDQHRANMNCGQILILWT